MGQIQKVTGSLNKSMSCEQKVGVGVGVIIFKFTRDLIKRGKQMSNSCLGLDLNKTGTKRHSEDNWRHLNMDWFEMILKVNFVRYDIVL